jgi:hypothetical protein
MEIGDGQQFGAAIGEPLKARQTLALRAVSIATRIVGDASLAAVLASLDVSAERRRTASLDRGHDLALIEREPVALRDAKTVAVAAEDVRHLQLRTHGALLFGRHDHEREPVEGAGDVGDQMSGDLRVACRRRQLGMPEQHLDDAKLDATFQEMCRKAVA